MNYNQFKNEVLCRLQETVGDRGVVRLFTVHKNNGLTLWAVSVMDDDSNIAPSIYLERYYQLYLKGRTVEELTHLILAENFRKQIRKPIATEVFQDPEAICERVLFRVINYDMNADFLAEVPHRRILDLAVIYYLEVSDPAIGNATVVIRDREAMRMGLKEETLYRRALANTPRMKPVRIESMTNALIALAGGQNLTGLPGEEDLPMYIAGNEDRVFGAAVLAYPDVFKDFADRLDSDLYIIPSSIHELILIAVRERFGRGELAEMVKEINATQVPPQEVLSNNVYTYVRGRNLVMM